MKELDIVILAAGKGERMVSRKPKVMHEILGKPLVGYVIDAAKGLDPSRVVVVTGYGRESVDAYLEGRGVMTAFQAEQKGTAHALSCARAELGGNDVLVLLGDVPLIEKDMLGDFIEFCHKARSVVFLVTDIDDPSGYGRMLMDGNIISDIREHSEASDEEKRVRTINTGICYIPFDDLALIDLIGEDNRKGERYLTDICRIAKGEGRPAQGYSYPRADEVLGVNTLQGLLEATMVMRKRINTGHMRNGVTFLGDDIYVGPEVTIGRGTVIHPACHITGRSVIGEDVSIGPCSMIVDCTINKNVNIRGFVSIEGFEINEGITMGPFEYHPVG
jgi:bifunctional UDP-N-acetylglucosamine pyrophosphorylase / glucosamine-1-phosphate N-acetyltransferase